jgi:FtsP/CotA-like multicopper oxidase with cupredoxin domain
MRGTSTIALLGAATLSLVAANPLLLSSSACATELPSLPTCSAVEPLKDCNAIERAGTDARRVQLSLTAKRAVVPIGPYMVDTETLNGTYLPPLLMLTPGQDFELKLTNKLETLPAPLSMVVATLNPQNPNDHSGDHVMPLTANNINLHTHGLIVSPKNARSTGHNSLSAGNGDNIFVDLAPNSSFVYDIDLPSTLTYPGVQRVDHPEGLFWYHPHIHGLAQRQISAGMAGPIAIGSPITYLRRMSDLGLAYKDDAFTGNIEPHVIVLKDIIVSTEKDPSELAGKPRADAMWIGLKEASGSATYPTEWAAGFLPTTCQEAAAGWCVPDATGDRAVPRPENFAKKLIWMFTTNGELNPAIPVGEGHFALLRIVNESPSVSYDLRFGAYPDGGLPFYVIGLEASCRETFPLNLRH